MKLKIDIKKPDWDPNPEKSKTNNHDWRQCVIVTFPNCDFKWLPTYKQLEDIREALKKCEFINSDIAKSINKNHNL